MEVKFNVNEHLMKIGKGENAKDYLPVAWRLVWVNDVVDRAVAAGEEVKLDIDTEEIDCDLDKEFSAEVFVWNNEKRRSEKVAKIEKGYAKYKATVTLQIGSMTKRASATKSERAVDFPDFIEKANTGAVGRALAMIGFGTQFTGPEFDEGTERIVDAPVDRSSQSNAEPGSTEPARPRQISDSNAPANRPASASMTQQNKALQDLLHKSKGMAQEYGVAWEDEKLRVLGKPVPDSRLTAQQIGLINADLAKNRGDKAS